jgi:hypothetical protein
MLTGSDITTGLMHWYMCLTGAPRMAASVVREEDRFSEKTTWWSTHAKDTG